MPKSLARKITIYIDGTQVENTLAGMQKQLAKLKNEQKHCTIGSADYIEKTEKIAQLKRYIEDHNGNVKQLEKSWKSATDKAATYSEILQGAKALMGMAGRAYGKMAEYVEKAAAMDDAMAQVEKRTGMSAGEVEKLNEAFKRMDTRTTREDLNAMAYDAGKFGLDTAESVGSFVQAADKLHLALGDELKDIEAFGKTVTMYAQSTAGLQGTDLGGQMERVGSAIRALNTNAGNMQEFMLTLGATATAAGLSADEVLGYAAAVDNAGISSTRGAKALQQLLQRMTEKSSEFAQVAGMGVKEFNELVGTDMNAALQRVLQGISQAGGMDALGPMLKDLGAQGSGTAAVLLTLSQNIDTVRESQATAASQLQNATALTEEYARQNDTAAARLEICRKKTEEARMELGNALYPAFLKVTQAAAGTVKVLSSLMQPLVRHPQLLAAYASALIALNWAKVTAGAKQAAAAVKAFGTAVKANPWGAALTAVAALATGVAALVDKLKSQNKAMKEAQASIAEASARASQEVDNLFEPLRNAAAGTEQYNSALAKLKELYPDIIQAHLDDRGNLRDVEAAYRDVSAAAIASAEAEARRQLLVEAAAKRERSIMEDLQDIRNGTLWNSMHNARLDRVVQDIREGGDWKNSRDYKELANLTGAGNIKKNLKEIAKAVEEYRRLEQELKRVAGEAGSSGSSGSSGSAGVSGGSGVSGKSGSAGSSGSSGGSGKAGKAEPKTAQPIDLSKAFGRDALEGLDQWQRRIVEAQDEYHKLAAEIDNAILANEKIINLPSASSSLKEDAAKANALLREQRTELDALYEKTLAKVDTDRTAAEMQQLQAEATERQADAWQRVSDAIEAAADSEERAAQNAEKLKRKFDETVAQVETFGQKAMDIFSSVNTIMDNQGDRELKEHERQKEAALKSIDQQLEASVISQEQYNSRKQQIEEQYAEKEKQIKLEQWRREKAMNISQAIMNGALAAAKAWSQGGAYGAALAAIAAAGTAAQVAAIASQPEPYARGGFVTEPTVGLVGEAGSEWIASHGLLQNPRTAPVIAALDRYQKGGSLTLPGTERQTAILEDLAAYLKDPRNRQAVISRRHQEDFDRSENFLRQQARL